MGDEQLGYVPVPISLIPRDINGRCSTNLYVYLPSQERFILFVPAGEKFTLSRKMALEKHIVPALFIRNGEEKKEQAIPPEGVRSEQDAELELLGAAGTATLRKIFHRLTDPDGNPEQAIEQLSHAAEEIIKIVAPDVDDLKARILKQAENVWVMNDSSAIITIATLFAAANGFDSPKSLRDIVYSVLVMDLPLLALGEEAVEKAYLNPEDLPPDLLEKYRNHPLEAYRIAKQSLRYFTETALQLILNHHEYKNGLGWPRKIRTETLFPLAKVLSASVDAFERMKRSQIMGRPLSLNEAVAALLEPEVEAHQRRHNREIVDKVIEFLAPGASGNSSTKQAA